MYSCSFEEFYGILSREIGRKLVHELATILTVASSRERAMSRDLADSPLFSHLASLGARIYTSGRILLDTDTLVIFTCGASATPGAFAREQLLRYASRYFHHGSFFRAEDAFPVLLKSKKDDLLTIEHRLADYSDCVIIVNESASTLAELGAFASNQTIVKKLLVVNPREHRDANSFINLGPIAKADNKSKFKKTIHVDLASVSLHFDTILKRIEDKAVRKKRLGVDFSKADAWKTSDPKLRLLLLKDILNLFCPMTRKELLQVMKTCFLSQYVNFNVELGLLFAMRKVFEEKELLITSIDCSQHSYYIDNRAWLGLRKKVVDTYRHTDSSRLNFLLKRSAEAS